MAGGSEWDVGCRAVRSTWCVVRSTWYVVGRYAALGACETTYYGVSTDHWPQATYLLQNPHPGPPRRGGRFARRKLRATGHPVTVTTRHVLRASKDGHTGSPLRRDDAHHEPQLQATCYRPHAAFPDSPDEAGRAGRDPGSMPHEPPRLCRRPVRRELCATRRPATVTTHHVLRTANPQGGHMGPPLRRNNTHHEPQATGHRPLSRHSSQASLGARASQSRLGSLRRTWTQ